MLTPAEAKAILAKLQELAACDPKPPEDFPDQEWEAAWNRPIAREPSRPVEAPDR